MKSIIKNNESKSKSKSKSKSESESESEKKDKLLISKVKKYINNT